MRCEAEPIDFPMLPVPTAAATDAGVQMITPPLPPLDLSHIEPTVPPPRRASSFNLAQKASDGSDELELSYQSSVDMPFDISLNSTMLLDDSFSFGPADLYARPCLDELIAAAQIDFPPDASPLAREPPLAEIAPLWHCTPRPPSTGVAERLHLVESLMPDIGQRLKALELENRLLREQLTGMTGPPD